VTSKCGTYAGWNQHQQRGSKPCGECNSAQARYIREWRIRNGHTKSVNVPVDVMQEALKSLDAWTVLYRHLGPDMVDAIKHAPKASGEAATKK
jgi:hypothetical protein